MSIKKDRAIEKPWVKMSCNHLEKQTEKGQKSNLSITWPLIYTFAPSYAISAVYQLLYRCVFVKLCPVFVSSIFYSLCTIFAKNTLVMI